MSEGIIRKALSGFYYVDDGQTVTACRARGKHRYAGQAPLVGDRVRFTPLENGAGALDEILPRKNEFYRPAVANIDLLVVVAAQAVPVTDPYLIDRVVAIAESRGCDSLICVNKCDLASGEDLARIYEKAGFHTVRLSAQTGEGIDELRQAIAGKVCAFTGNSGVGKSSLLNALEPDMDLATAQVSDKLGRVAHHPPCGAVPPVLWGSGGGYPRLLLLRCGLYGAGAEGGAPVRLSGVCPLPGQMPVPGLRPSEGEGLRRVGGGGGGGDPQKPAPELCAPLCGGQSHPGLGVERRQKKIDPRAAGASGRLFVVTPLGGNHIMD